MSASTLIVWVHWSTISLLCTGVVWVKRGGGGGMGGMHQYISPDCLGMWFTLSG